ncbi:MAG TPA: hypothetical protein VMD59_19110, partial [Acidimicrobiales bacterium]|nr:hypothetical protein [Acidimicrobiales bacterium]
MSDPGPVELHLAALACMNAGRNEQAIDLFSRALAGGVADAAYPLGSLLARAGRLEEAIAAMDRAVEVPGSELAASVFLARLHLARHDVPGAVSAATAAVRLARVAPGEEGSPVMAVVPAHWFQLAAALSEAGEHLLSGDCFEECAGIGDPALAEAASENASRQRAAAAASVASPGVAGEATEALAGLLAALDAGSISLTQALGAVEQSAGPPPSEALAVHWLGRATELSATRWSDGFAIAQVVLAAARHGRAERTLCHVVDLSFVRYACSALGVLPHPRLYKLALEAAGEALELASAAGDDERRCQALIARAALHTGPYISLRSADDLDNQLRLWHESLDRRLGASAAAAARAADGDLPELGAALELAEKDLDLASTASDPQLGATAESRLSEVLFWRSGLAGDGEAARRRQGSVERAARALRLLDATAHPDEVARVLRTLEVCGAVADLGVIEPILSTSLDEWARRLPPAQLYSLVEQLANLLGERDPARALSLLHDAHPLLEDAPEQVRLSCWMKETLLIPALVGARYPFSPSLVEAVDEPADARLRGATMMAAVLALSAMEKLHEARRMLERFERVAPTLAAAHAEAVDYTRTML